MMMCINIQVREFYWFPKCFGKW